jgi:hypothetical protein
MGRVEPSPCVAPARVHARLHDVNNARLDIPDSKTETGIRVLELSPELAEALNAHINRLARAGNDTRPTAPLFQNERGGKMTRKSVGTVVREATEPIDSAEMRNQSALPSHSRTTTATASNPGELPEPQIATLTGRLSHL